MKLKEFSRKNRYTVMLLILMAVVLAFFTITKGSSLWKVSVWSGMTMQFPEYGLMTLGLMFCFIIGRMDMSFVALGNFASIMAVQYMVAHVTDGMSDGQTGGVIIVGLLIAIGFAVIGGIINGLLVSMLDIPPVMATIAMQLVWQGLSTALTKGNTVTGLPALYTTIGHMKFGNFLSVPLIIFIVIFIICWILLRFTTYGEKLYMIGTNIKAAHFSAINTRAMIIWTFVLCDVISTIGTMIMVSTMASAKADYGTSYVMRCILILVLAGVIPDGGMGKILDVLLAIITIQIIATGVNLFAELNTYYASLIWGGLLIIVLILSTKMNGDKLFNIKKKSAPSKKQTA